MKTLVCLLCLFRIALFCRASVPPIRSGNFPFAGELPSNEITDIYQDSTGFIWLGTSNGLARYDGHDIQTFRSDYRHPGLLADNRITCFAEDTHYIYIGTGRGLNLYDKQTMQIRPFRCEEPNQAYINALCSTPNGFIWGSADGRLFRIDPKNGRYKSYAISLPDGTAIRCNSFFVDRDNRLWICSRSGLIRYDETRERFVRYPSIGTHNNPSCLYQDKERRYWVLTWGDGLWMMLPDEKHESAVYRRQPLDNAQSQAYDERFFSIIQDDVYGYLWAMSYNSLYALRMSPQSGLLEPVDISGKVDVNKMYTKIIKDHDGNLWLSSYDHGTMISFPSEVVENYPLTALRDEQHRTPNLLTLCRDTEGCFWFNQDRFGICLLQTEENRMIYGSPELRRITIDARVMAPRRTGSGIWSAHVSAPVVYRLWQEEGRIRSAQAVDLSAVAGIKGAVRELTEDKAGNLWILAQNRIVEWDSRNSQHKTTAPSADFIRFAIDDEGKAWAVSPDNGIYALAPQKGRDITCKKLDVLPLNRNEEVQIMCADSRQCLWFSTSQGRIWQYDTEKRTFADFTKELNNEAIRVLNLLSRDRRLWVVTYHKVIQYDIENGSRTEYKVPDDYITVRIFRDQTSCLDREGTFYAGGNGGFVAIDPPSAPVRPIENTFPIVLSDVKIDGESIFFTEQRYATYGSPDKENIRLSHHDRNISIAFTTLHSLSTRKFRYAFKLEGTDEQWIYPAEGVHTAYYNKIGKGSHRLWVKQADENGQYGTETQLISIFVEPAWWETPWAYLGYAVLIALTIGMALRIYIFRLKQKNRRQLQESITQTKLDYFTNVSHELLTPLTVISCIADYWEQQYPKEEEQTGIMRNHIYRLKHLLQQVLDFRRSESGQMVLKVRYGNITAFIRQVCPTNFLPVAKQKRLQIRTSVPAEEIRGYLDFDKVDKVLYNLFSNAIKYTPSGKNIDFTAEIRTAQRARDIVFTIKDEGVGIPLKEQQRIFNRFYTGSNGQGGLSNGIGLALTKELTELHHGSIQLESKPGKGSTFTVILPIDRDAYAEEEIETEVTDTVHTAEVQDTAVESPADTAGRDVIMLVDDNKDLLETMKRLFSPQYEVLTATDGQQALRMLEHTAPDIIVSDVMMPETDGLTFCRCIKSQTETSHIPVVLLTARRTSDDRIEAYNAGADGYLAKPFEAKVLQAKIDNLIRACRKRQQAFRKEDRIRLNELEFQPEDTHFLQAITDYIHAHLEDGDCGVDQLANHVHVSKSTLHRKVKAMTGLTPLDFVRNIRLKYACMMLVQPNVTISEVAYATGFSSPKYFTKCFKEDFGLTPTEYQQQKAR